MINSKYKFKKIKNQIKNSNYKNLNNIIRKFNKETIKFYKNKSKYQIKEKSSILKINNLNLFMNQYLNN